MSEFPVEGGENGDMQSVIENFQKKSNLMSARTTGHHTHVSHHPQVTTSSQVRKQIENKVLFILYEESIKLPRRYLIVGNT